MEKNVWQDELIHSESLHLENKQVGEVPGR